MNVKGVNKYRKTMVTISNTIEEVKGNLINKFNHVKRNPFTALPNTTMKDLGWAPNEMCLLMHLLNNRQDYVIRTKHFSRELGICHKTFLKHYRSLMAKGYAERIQVRDALGKITGEYHHILYDTKQEHLITESYSHVNSITPSVNRIGKASTPEGTFTNPGECPPYQEELIYNKNTPPPLLSPLTPPTPNQKRMNSPVINPKRNKRENTKAAKAGGKLINGEAKAEAKEIEGIKKLVVPAFDKAYPQQRLKFHKDPKTLANENEDLKPVSYSNSPQKADANDCKERVLALIASGIKDRSGNKLTAKSGALARFLEDRVWKDLDPWLQHEICNCDLMALRRQREERENTHRFAAVEQDQKDKDERWAWQDVENSIRTKTFLKHFGADLAERPHPILENGSDLTGLSEAIIILDRFDSETDRVEDYRLDLAKEFNKKKNLDNLTPKERKT